MDAVNSSAAAATAQYAARPGRRAARMRSVAKPIAAPRARAVVTASAAAGARNAAPTAPAKYAAPRAKHAAPMPRVAGPIAATRDRPVVTAPAAALALARPVANRATAAYVAARAGYAAVVDAADQAPHPAILVRTRSVRVTASSLWPNPRSPVTDSLYVSSLTASTEALSLSSYRFLRRLTFRNRRSSKKSAKRGGLRPNSVARSSGSGESGSTR